MQFLFLLFSADLQGRILVWLVLKANCLSCAFKMTLDHSHGMASLVQHLYFWLTLIGAADFQAVTQF